MDVAWCRFGFSRFASFLSVFEITYITPGMVGGERGDALNQQTPPHMKAAPSSGLHYWHTDI